MQSFLRMFLDQAAAAPSKNTPKAISAQEAKQMMDTTRDLVILDVRTSSEFRQGHIKNALLLPYTSIEQQASRLPEDKATTILVYCQSGGRSAVAAKTLCKLGYTSVYNFGGIMGWPYGIVRD